MSRKSGVKKTDSPIIRKIKTPVIRCSATPQNSGFSPGAVESRSLKEESVKFKRLYVQLTFVSNC